MIFISYNNYSQKLFKENGNREFSDTLNVNLLHKVCDNLEINISDVYINQSHSIFFKQNITFFALQYIIKNTKHGNLYKVKYLFADNSNGRVIDQIDDKGSFFDAEALQVSPSNILKNKIQLNDNIFGIGIITEESIKSLRPVRTSSRRFQKIAPSISIS